MKSIKSLTASMGVALYILARIPPTDLCPFKFSNVAYLHSLKIIHQMQGLSEEMGYS